MAEHLSNLARFFISAAAVPSTTDTAAEYGALAWVEILNLYDLGEWGDLANAVESTTLRNNRVKRLKGLVDGGTAEIIVNRDADDAGQDKLEEARKSPFDYAFRAVLPDKLTEDGDGTTYYFKASVLGGRTSYGEADNVVRTTWSLAINSERLEVAAD